MEGASQRDDRDVRKRLKELTVKADKAKSYSAETAHSAYNDIMTQANTILVDIDKPRGNNLYKKIHTLFLTDFEFHFSVHRGTYGLSYFWNYGS